MSDIHSVDQALTSSVEASQPAEQLQREHRRESRLTMGHGFSFTVMSAFFIVMMICLVAGVAIYRGVSTQHARTNDLRMQSGLLVNIVRMNDMADCVQRAAGPEGDALVLVTTLDSGTYETRVYLYQGAIVQEYAIAGRPFNPDNAVRVVESSSFGFDFRDGLVSMYTDDGCFQVAIRSAQAMDTPGATSNDTISAGAGAGAGGSAAGGGF